MLLKKITTSSPDPGSRLRWWDRTRTWGGFWRFWELPPVTGPQEKTLLEVLGSPGLAVHDVLNTPRCKV